MSLVVGRVFRDFFTTLAALIARYYSFVLVVYVFINFFSFTFKLCSVIFRSPVSGRGLLVAASGGSAGGPGGAVRCRRGRCPRSVGPVGGGGFGGAAILHGAGSHSDSAATALDATRGGGPGARRRASSGGKSFAN